LETILPILIWGGLFFLMMRFGCGSHMFGHGHGKKPGQGQSHDHAGHAHHAEKSPTRNEELVWTAPEKDVDPVCGKGVVTAEAKSTVHNGWVYYFCSRECREAFEAAPETYVGAQGHASPQTPTPSLEHQPEEGRSHA
jgi:YHS domain-containing protein